MVDQAPILIRSGKYSAADKLEILSRFWATGDSGLPQEDRIDWHGRDTLANWQGWGLQAGRRAFQAYIRQFDAGSGREAQSGFERLVQENHPIARNLADMLVTALPGGGLDQIPALSGLPADVVAEAAGVFRAGMLDGLLYTNDAGEIPGIRLLNAIAGPFPVSHLADNTSALCLFTHSYFGSQDVIHVYNAAVPQVTLVDIDAPRTAAMRLIYPPHWSYAVADFREFIEQSLGDGTKYDLVTADPDLSLVEEVTDDGLGRFAALTRRILCLGYTGEGLTRDGFDDGGIDGMSEVISKRIGSKITVVEIMHRNTLVKRNLKVYWAVLSMV